MAANHNDPKLLYAIDGVKAYHISHGHEESLTPAGSQTLSLLMVPAASAFADVSSSNKHAEDFYLHLHLPPELDLPLPATTQIYHQPPSSYLIPRWDLGPDAAAFTRIEFPAAGSRLGLREDVDTFETILAQCTAFLERVPPPRSVPKSRSSRSAKEREAFGSPTSEKSGLSEPLPPYNPGSFAPGQAYASGSVSQGHSGRIVLIDEEDGSVVGELSERYTVDEHLIKQGSKEPVEISFPANGSGPINVTPMTEEYQELDMHPAYQKSTLVDGARKASRLIVTTSDLLTRTIQNQAKNYVKSTAPTTTPIKFNANTHENIRKINNLSAKAAQVSATTVGHIGKVAQSFGASIGRKKDGSGKGYDGNGNFILDYKPGLLNKSLMAFNTVIDGIDYATKNLLTGTSSSVTTVVDHKWGPEAGHVSRNVGSGVKNVALVYIDVTGVSRKAILKSVAKGMVVGKVSNGDTVIVGGEDGGATLSPTDLKPASTHRIDTSSSSSSGKSKTERYN